MKAKIIALYKGDEYIDTGTVYKLAAKYNINYNTLRWLATPTARKKQAGRKLRSWHVVVLEDSK